LQVNFDSSNRLVVAFSGTVKDFNETFKTTLHICMRKNPQQGNPPFPVYCTLGELHAAEVRGGADDGAADGGPAGGRRDAAGRGGDVVPRTRRGTAAR
jgi:kumamolisin